MTPFFFFLSSLQCPILIAWGDKDPWEPLELGRNYGNFDSVEDFVVLPNVGHCPQVHPFSLSNPTTHTHTQEGTRGGIDLVVFLCDTIISILQLLWGALFIYFIYLFLVSKCSSCKTGKIVKDYNINFINDKNPILKVLNLLGDRQ